MKNAWEGVASKWLIYTKTLPEFINKEEGEYTDIYEQVINKAQK